MKKQDNRFKDLNKFTKKDLITIIKKQDKILHNAEYNMHQLHKEINGLIYSIKIIFNHGELIDDFDYDFESTPAKKQELKGYI